MSIRKISILAAGLIALGASSAATAGVIGDALEKSAKKQEEREQAREAKSQPAAPRSQPSAPREEAGPRNQPSAAPQARNQNSRGNDVPRQSTVPRDSNRGGLITEGLARNSRNNDPGRGNDRGDRDDHSNRGDRGGDHRGDYRPRQTRIVQTLPRGYRNYDWNGRHYYTYGGVWYEPYGSSYVSIGAPYGLFVSALPGYSSSFYYGNTRYYYLDDTYYTYEPVRRGYVVARSPYGDDDSDDYYYDEQPDEDMYIYPAKGQSEQQQADDRYACHRWGVDQTGYDPIDDDYDRGKRGEYVRAMTACLTGRGYSVR